VTLAQLQAASLDAAGLESAVNTLYKAYDTQAGVTTTDPEARWGYRRYKGTRAGSPRHGTRGDR
jgi:hypothetical protein